MTDSRRPTSTGLARALYCYPTSAPRIIPVPPGAAYGPLHALRKKPLHRVRPRRRASPKTPPLPSWHSPRRPRPRRPVRARSDPPALTHTRARGLVVRAQTRSNTAARRAGARVDCAVTLISYDGFAGTSLSGVSQWRFRPCSTVSRVKPGARERRFRWYLWNNEPPHFMFG